MGFLETAPGFSPADVQCTVKYWMNTVQEHSSLMWHEAESKKKGRISSLLTDYETTHFGVPVSLFITQSSGVWESPQLTTVTAKEKGTRSRGWEMRAYAIGFTAQQIFGGQVLRGLRVLASLA